MSKSGDDNGGGSDDDDSGEEELISEEEKKKCIEAFKRLAKNTNYIRVEEATAIAKSISEDPAFPEEDVLDIINDNSVFTNRKLNLNHFFKLIEEIKRR